MDGGRGIEARNIMYECEIGGGSSGKLGSESHGRRGSESHASRPYNKHSLDVTAPTTARFGAAYWGHCGMGDLRLDVLGTCRAVESQSTHFAAPRPFSAHISPNSANKKHYFRSSEADLYSALSTGQAKRTDLDSALITGQAEGASLTCTWLLSTCWLDL